MFLEWKYKEDMHVVRDIESTWSSLDRTCLTGNLRSMGSLSSMFSDFLPSDGTASATPNKHNVNLKHQGWGNQSKIMFLVANAFQSEVTWHTSKTCD
jgi:hypothetical protein